MSPARASIGTICTRVSDMDVVRPRGPGAGGVLAQRAHEHPAQRGALAGGADARGPLELARNVTHEIDTRDRHPHEGPARHARARHLAPTNLAKLMTGSPSHDACHLRPPRPCHGRVAASERSTTFKLVIRSVPAATAAAMLGKPTWDSSTVSPA